MAKRYNPNKCKINRNYTVSDIAKLYGVHKNTVKNWIKRGLKKIDNHRPYLILGSELREFLKDLRTINKRPCEFGEIYCFCCNSAREPLQESIEFEPYNLSLFVLKGRCNICNSLMNKYQRLEDLARLQRYFAVILPLQQKRLS
ncbi:helix-turn-helix domain-containing protein [Colwellia demingiae]|uniref:Helix-turn-helix domain-containing protein n=1 Tax=Colwellia demingiae TaxID=89401 RepID=A0A5C6QBC5_9GAMM|nr:helix-turn-helix domain-containing protein [Colwellia demingiae]TWX65947.1 helix-turn-helix domain-containing protein [Colwellia demingiae]